MLKRMLWTVILVVAILVDLWWLDRALGDYAAPIDLIVISALSIIMMFAAMQIVGLIVVTQSWVDTVEVVDEEEEEYKRLEFANTVRNEEIAKIHKFYTLLPKPHMISGDQRVAEALTIVNKTVKEEVDKQA